LVAGIVVVTALVGTVSELGFGSYLIYRRDRSRMEARIVAPLACASALLGAGLIAAMGGPLAEFYRQPSDRMVAVAMSVNVLMSTLSALPAGVLRSELRFRELGLIQAAGEVAALLVAIPLALWGAGIWALVAGYTATSVVNLVAAWLVSEIGRPRLERHWRSVWTAAFQYGSRVAAGAALWSIAFQADNAIVGRSLGPAALGLYAVAYSYGALPGAMLSGLVNQVAFPVFSLTAFDRAKLTEHFTRFVRISAMTVLPMTAAGIALSGVAVDLVLGPQWREAVVPLQLFLAMGAIRGLFPAGDVLKALGRINIDLVVGAIGAPAVILSAILGSAGGISAVALLVTAVFTVTDLTAVLVACHLIALSPKVLLLAIVPSIGLSAAIGLVDHAVVSQLAPHPVLSISVGVVSSLMLYGVGITFLPGGTEIRRMIIRRA
jgi:PST family polysaccharide transporter